MFTQNTAAGLHCVSMRTRIEFTDQLITLSEHFALGIETIQYKTIYLLRWEMQV